jgi:hypothetical protein
VVGTNGALDPSNRISSFAPSELALLQLKNAKTSQYLRIARPVTGLRSIQMVAIGQGMNRYSYVLNNPLAFTDPTGLEEEVKAADSTKGDVKCFSCTVVYDSRAVDKYQARELVASSREALEEGWASWRSP